MVRFPSSVGAIVTLTLLMVYVGAFSRSWSHRSSSMRLWRFEAATSADLLSASEVLLPTKESVLSKHQPSSPRKKERKQNSKRASRLFGRTNRVDGFVKWVNELNLYRAAVNSSSPPASPALIVELAKELLWSNMPEQCLELYAAYVDLVIGEKKSITTETAANTTVIAAMPVAPDTKLIQCATRAFIFLGDAKGALKLLQATSRSGLDFDSMTKSLLMSDLAECSPEGLQAALRLRTSMKERRERIHANAYVGLLKGCWTHGLSPRQRGDSPLLVEAAEEERAIIDELGNSFRLSADKAEELALEVAAEYMAVTNRESAAAAALTGNSTLNATANGKRPAPVPTKKNLPVMTEALRVLFRVAVMRTHSKVLDRNLEVDQSSDRELKAKAGLKYALAIMKQYKLKFTIQIADLLIDECLRIGDLSGVKFVVQRMWNSRLYAKTTTYNTLLKRYAENGDGESAHGLVTKVMAQNEDTQPNSETYALLLEACMRTERGRYYAKEVIGQLRREEGGLRKTEWDSLMELRVMAAEPYWPVLLEMVASGEQPDDRSMTLLMEAFSRIGDHSGALRLHRLQVAAETRRRAFRKHLLGATEAAEGSEQKQLLATPKQTDETMHLPPPSKRSVNCLLEILRDASTSTTNTSSLSSLASASANASAALPVPVLRTHEEATKVLDDMCDRAKDFLDKNQATKWNSKQQVLPVTFTDSGKLLLAQSFSPDQTTFALAMEACVNAGDADCALQTFSRMEAFGLQPDRRVYAALIRAFGLRRDVPSALGVFDEMRRNFAPDVNNLMSILEVCLFDPLDLRLLCGVLEKMGDDGCDLEVYSCDILMQLFPDALTLGAALVDMEEQPVPEGFECTTASLGVIAVLVQAVRKDGGLSALTTAMSFLGSVGIRPDKETMEYFRIPVAPAPGTPNSRHHNKLLVPHRQRVRSLMDLNMPAEFASPDLDLPVSPSAARPKLEPYFGAGTDDWADHVRVLGKALVGAADDNDEDGDEDNNLLLSLGAGDGQSDASLDVERLLLEGAFDGLDDEEEGENEGDTPRRGTGPFGEELMEEELQWPDAVAIKPVTLLPLEIQESFLGQARPRAKPADVWVPTPRKVKSSADASPRTPTQIKPRAPAPGQQRPAASAGAGRTRSADFDQDLLALSNGGHGKYSDEAAAAAGTRGRDTKARQPTGTGPRTAPGSAARAGPARRNSRANKYR